MIVKLEDKFMNDDKPTKTSTPLITHPMTLIVGPSGTGKSYSAKNLPKDKTAIINIERKVLPFKDGMKFAYQYYDDEINQIEIKIDDEINRVETEYIFIDSFTKYWERLLMFSKSFNKGYDIYNFLNDRLFKFFEKLKLAKKFIILTAIDEIVVGINDSGGQTFQRRCAVVGKQWEGKVEKEFSVVLWPEIKNEKANTTYNFVTNGFYSAKSPEGLFPRIIPNDINFVCKQMKNYYEL